MANAASLRPTLLPPEKTEQKFRWLPRWRARDDQLPCLDEKHDPAASKPSFGRRLSKKVVPGLPRPGTFKRQNSERREKLTPVETSVNERRTVSADRRALSARPTSPHVSLPQRSAPEVRSLDDGCPPATQQETRPESMAHPGDNVQSAPLSSPSPPPPPPPLQPPEDANPDAEPPPSDAEYEDEIDEEIRQELERKWILNLSMHFRDHSPREKFFLTYAESPHQWRRVTVSCDYRDVPPESLERDLQSLSYQRDKSARIYEAIRSSLPEIQFYDTVTNLKLETRDDRLHVHVTEDVNEKIPYPGVHTVQHLQCRRYPEHELNFESHMSGFVYKVNVHGQIWIKKEIPGPDSVDEFLYEINALNELIGSKNVIQFQGLVVDATESVVKGLLISFAAKGALVDILYDNKGDLPWSRREQWARQIVQGLSEIHEAGFVQGDFTLSNIVIDESDEAKIIDINRRGCPVGWEPPEISKLVENGQRISMYIGVKSDLFQLGMVLWALAEEEDEPERKERPLTLDHLRGEIPEHYRKLVNSCLSVRPKDRLGAKDLLPIFPELNGENRRPRSSPNHRSRSSSADRFSARSVVNADGQRFDRTSFRERQFSRGDYAYDSYPGSIDLPFDGPGSYIVSRRGRPPAVNANHLNPSHRSEDGSPGHSDRGEPQVVTVSPSRGHRWEEFQLNGNPYLIQRDSVHLEDSEFGLAGLATAESRREFAHVDSGLADMDMNLVGVSGGHEALRTDCAGKGDGVGGGSGGGDKSTSTPELGFEDEVDLLRLDVDVDVESKTAKTVAGKAEG